MSTGARNGKPTYIPKMKPKNQIHRELVKRRTRSRRERLEEERDLASSTRVKFVENLESGIKNSLAGIIFD
jgi:hypothetical protein